MVSCGLGWVVVGAIGMTSSTYDRAFSVGALTFGTGIVLAVWTVILNSISGAKKCFETLTASRLYL